MLLEMIVIGGKLNIANGLHWEQTLFAILVTLAGVVAMNLPYWKPKGPLVECLAAIKSKRIEYSKTPQMNYMILFVDENGNEVELYTMESIYVKLKEGDIGKLKYQRGTLIEFAQQKWYESPIQIN